jgi:hypothetical protein
MLRKNFPIRKEIRKTEAVARKEAREKLGDAGQLARLQRSLPGGANKEKARLNKKLSEAKK